jgi:hypothetical protein
MAIMIREFMGSEGIQVDWNYAPHNPLDVNESAVGIIPDHSIMADIEGIHVGPTRNFTWYTEEALDSSKPTWTHPYRRPLIMHHNEKDGKIIGRILNAEKISKSAKSGTPALLFTAVIPDKEGKEQVEDGRLNTVSIGVIVHDARCSICGHNIAENGPCEHERGVKYDGKVCYWIIYKMEAKELSYVIVPSDMYAQNVRIYKPTSKDFKESLSKGVFNLTFDENGKPIQEGAIINENGDKPIDTPPADPTPTPTPAPAGEDVEKLKKEIETLTTKNKDLEKQVEDLTASVKAKEEAATAASKDLEDTKVLLDQANKEIKSAQDKLTLKEAELINERTLRENAETNIIDMTAQVRNSLIESVMDLRQALGKPVAVKEELDKRSDDSLKDAIKDLKEEMTIKGVDPTKITPAANPTLVENKDNQDPNVKKEKKASNIDLQEGLIEVFGSVMGSKSKIG